MNEFPFEEIKVEEEEEIKLEEIKVEIAPAKKGRKGKK